MKTSITVFKDLSSYFGEYSVIIIYSNKGQRYKGKTAVDIKHNLSNDQFFFNSKGDSTIARSIKKHKMSVLFLIVYLWVAFL